jgi:Nucleotidyltransferase domain
MPSDPVHTARALVGERFPDAVQAWLAGSVTTGQATATSDLDVTVLLDEGDVHRESLVYDGWPVELFVHTAASVEHYVVKDLARRRPTMARLVATGVPLLSEGGDDVRRRCQDVLDTGPPPVTAADLEAQRYGLTDLLDDLAGAGHDEEATAIAVEVWRATAELALAAAVAWSGTGKWLVRELGALDERRGTHLTTALDLGLHRALAGERTSLTAVADEVLAPLGGRRWAGFRRSADDQD